MPAFPKVRAVANWWAVKVLQECNVLNFVIKFEITTKSLYKYNQD